MLELVWRKSKDQESESLYILTPLRPYKKVATVWNNGTWHTWHPVTGNGGENAVATNQPDAKTMALGSVIEQGFMVGEITVSEL